MPDREKVIKGLECIIWEVDHNSMWLPGDDDIRDAIVLLKEQEDDYKNILSDYEDLAREHEKLLDKKIPLITNGQEVVRCKECSFAFYKEGLVPEGYIFCTKPGTERWQAVKPDDWFCADGERGESE